MMTLAAPYDASISCKRGGWQDWEGNARNGKPVDRNIISLTISELVEWEFARGGAD